MQPEDENHQLENLHYRVGQVHSANTTVKFRVPLVNPFFAQLYSVLLGLLFTFKQLALDSMNLNQRYMAKTETIAGLPAAENYRNYRKKQPSTKKLTGELRSSLAQIETLEQALLGQTQIDLSIQA